MRTTIAYQPALDGVRALAVSAVLLFHAGVGGFGGGYLGVSVFFTLSGYLITSLLVHEHTGGGRIDLSAFYARRLRRLLPASALCLALIVVFARVWFDGVEALRTHVLGAILQVANWVFLAGEGSYQDLLAEGAGAVSPVEHFWSLAIEEQFYWVWPPFVLALFRRVAAPGSRARAVGALTLAAFVAAPLIAVVWGPDAAYWSTPARVGEILAGAWLALALAGRDTPLDERWRWAAPGALAVLALFVVTWPSAGGPAYRGGLPLVAAVSTALLAGLQVAGPVRRALAWGPLVWLGTVSYGAYLYHWPIFVVLDHDRTGLDGVALLALRLTVTMAVTAASFYAFERPIRQWSGPRRVTYVGAAAATVAVVAVAVFVAPGGHGEYWRVDPSRVEAAAIDPTDTNPLVPLTTAATTSSTTTTTTPAITPAMAAGAPTANVAPVPATTTSTTTLAPLPELPRPVRIVVTGDSTANALGAGVVTWAAANPHLAQVEVFGRDGCGFVPGGEWRWGDGWRSSAACGNSLRDLQRVVSRTKPDVVAVMVSVWDVIDQRWDGGPVLSPLDPPYRERIEAAYAQLVTDLLAAGAGRVALVVEPLPRVGWDEWPNDEDSPARHGVLADVYGALAYTRPDEVAVVPLAAWFTAAGLDGDSAARPDGVHVTPEVATLLTEQFLGEHLLRIALRLPVAAVEPVAMGS